jgi:hypothetical protein
MPLPIPRGELGSGVTIQLRDKHLNPSEEAVGTSAVESDAQAEDRKLAAAILRNDRKATAEFVAKYADPIYRYVRCRLIPRMDLVDDLVQDVFLAAWGSRRPWFPEA